VTRGDAWARLDPVGLAQVPGTVSGDTIAYDVGGGVTISYRVTSTGLRSSLTLAGPGAPSTFWFDLTTSSGLRERAGTGDGVELLDAAGAVRLRLDAAVMSDRAGGPDGSSRDVSVKAEAAAAAGAGDTARRLVLSADRGWLADPKRAWPVTIDPGIGPDVSPDGGASVNVEPTFFNPVGDSHIVAAGHANTNFGSATEFELGVTGGTVHRRGVMAFGPSIPRDAEITFSELSLYHTALLNGGGTITADAYALTNGFNEAQVTWNRRDSANAWGTAGGDFDPTRRGSVSFTGTGYKRLIVTGLVREWVSGQRVNWGFLLRGHDSSTAADYVSRFGTTEGPADRQPTLRVIWTPYLGKRAEHTFDEQQLSDRSEAAVNVANGNLFLGNLDLAIKGTGLDLRITRVYNNMQDAAETAYAGRRWRMNIGDDHSLTVFPDGSVVWWGPSGEEWGFTHPIGDASTLTEPPGLNADLTRDTAAGTYALTYHKTRLKYTFRQVGVRAFLEEVRDRNNNRIDFVYDASNKLTSMTDTQGRSVTVTYVGDRIDKLTDTTGRVVDYDFDASDNLIKVTYPDNTFVRYGYTGDDLTSITDARGNVTTFAYDAEHRVTSRTRVTATPGDVDPTTTFVYNDTFTGTRPDFRAKTEVTDANNHTTIYEYDTRDRVTDVTDALGHDRKRTYNANNNVLTLSSSPTAGETNLTTFGYDSKNRLTSIAPQGGATTSFTYANTDAQREHLPTRRTDPSSRGLTYSYDLAGNLIRAQDTTTGSDTGGADAKQEHNPNGTLKSQTDGNGNTTTYTYVFAGGGTSGVMQKQTIDPPGTALGTTELNYDTLGRVTSLKDGKGQTRTYTYDKLDRVESVAVGGIMVSYAYDGNGNLTQQTDPTGTTILDYDELNRLTRKAPPGRIPITYTYDGVGNLESHTDQGGTLDYDYDAVNRLVWITEPGDRVIRFEYDNADRRTKTFFPNGVTVTLRYDRDGKQTQVLAQKGTNPAIVDLRYCYRVQTDNTACSPTSTTGADRDTRQKVTDDRTGQTIRYSYDTLGRLKTADTVAGPGIDHTYTYDKAGNRTSKNDGGTTTFYGYGEVNQLCWEKTTTTNPATSACTAPSAATTFTHDLNGNMTGNSAGFAATYNALDQTTSITPAGGSAFSPLTYAGTDQGERTRAGDTLFTTSALGLTVAAPATGLDATFYTRDNAGNLLTQRGPAVALPPSSSSSTSSSTSSSIPPPDPTGDRQYLILDALGSVVALTDGDTGAVLGRYSYDPYGKATHSGTVTSRFQFASGEHDPQTGLTKFGTRYYNPTLGRWTQRDPVQGDLTAPTTLNPYAYSACDPVNHTDPLGTQIRGCGGAYFDFAAAFFGYYTALFTFITATGPVGVAVGLIGVAIAIYYIASSRYAMDRECDYSRYYS